MDIWKIRQQSIELTVMSGDNLCLRKKPVTKNTFVIVKTNSSQERTTKMPTTENGTLTWNEKLTVELPPHACAAGFLSIEVHYKASSGKTKLVGEARVPISDFTVGFLPTNYLHFLSYRLSNRQGERNGVINISVRKEVGLVPEMGVPVSGRQRFGGVVTGVPAAWYGRPQPCSY